MQLALVEHAVLLEQLNRLCRDQLGECVQCGSQVRQTALSGFDLPVLRVPVAIEDHRTVLSDDVSQQRLHCAVEILAVSDGLLQSSGDVVQRVGHDRVEHDHRHVDGLSGAGRPELEPVSGERERAGSVAIARIGGQVWQRIHANDHGALAFGRRRRTLGNLLEYIGELVTEEDRDDRRWRLIGTEPMIVGRRGDRDTQQPAELVDRPDHRPAENKELGVLVRGVTRYEKAAELRIAQGEVDVLARSVDAREWLLVEKALQSVLLGDRLERGHQQLLMIGGDVRPFKHRGNLELAGRDLVVPGLGGNAELEQFPLGVHHEAEHPLRNSSEVMIVELLALGRLGAEQSAPRVDEIGPGQKEVPVDEEVLLLRAAERDNRIEVAVAKQLQDAFRLCAHCLLAAQQRRLVIQGLPRHGDEYRRNAQGAAVRVLQDVCGAGDIPAGVTARFEGATQPTRREAGCIGLTLDQGLAGELR